MAYATHRLYFTKYAYADSSTPTTVIDISGEQYVNLKIYSGSTGNWSGSALYFQFDELPQSLKHRYIYYISACIGTRSENRYQAAMAYTTDFDTNYLNWYNRPNLLDSGILKGYVPFNQTGSTPVAGDTTLSQTSSTATNMSTRAANFVRSRNGVVINWDGNSGFEVKLRTLTDGTSIPYIEVTYDNELSVASNIVVTSAPTTGYVNPRNDTIFEWNYVGDSTSEFACVGGDYEQLSATLYWKQSDDENYTSVPILGNTKNITIPSDTFPLRKTIQWYLEGTDDTETTSQTAVYSFTTADSYISTTPVRPKDSVEDGSSPITLSWTYTSPNGTTPTGYRIYYKGVNDNEFTVLTDVTGTASTSHTAPANTFPSGEVEWYAMMLNADGIGNAGYCTHAKFINYAAPSVPVLSVDQAPYITMNWQSSEQEAYEVQIDDTTYGPYFGTEKSFELPDYLTDGQHTIKLRVLGGYNLWSNWAEMTITVENVPGSTVTISAQSHIDTELSWETESETPDYLVFRDGKQIAKTNKTAFVDRFVTGEHSYYIINKLSDGNYTKSNEIDAGSVLDTMYIALVNGGAWTKIRYNLVDQSDAGYEDSIDSTYNHLAGDVYPSATLGTYRESNVSLSAVFLYTEEEERKQFEALFGKLVIIKFKDGNVLFGVLDSWNKQARKHYWTGYTFTIRRVEWEDFVDDTD